MQIGKALFSHFRVGVYGQFMVYRRQRGYLYSPRNDPDPEMIPNPEMIPKLTLK